MTVAVDRGRDQAVLNALEAINGVMNPINQNHSYITQLASSLRLLLIHGELQKSAISYGLSLLMAKTSDIDIQLSDGIDIIFGMMGVGVFHEVNIDGFLWAYNRPAKKIPWSPLSPPEDPNRWETMSLSEFVNQKVLSIPNCVISRQQLIHYASNKMGVSHYDTKRGKHNDIAIDRAKNSLWIKIENKKSEMHFNTHVPHAEETEIHIDERKFDCVILQLFSTAFMMNLSFDIVNFRNFLSKRN